MTSIFPEMNQPEQAARLAPKLRGLATEGIYFGTSSWKYPGWIGSIYSEDRYRPRGKFSQKNFDENCLSEYAQVFPTVCGDFAFYQFPTRDYWDRLLAQVPNDFLVGLKVPEDITIASWPNHVRPEHRRGKKTRKPGGLRVLLLTMEVNRADGSGTRIGTRIWYKLLGT